ncbi:hypothetical protein NM688_g852 [Phlebia brevispora]|uniref:Uncharacterized protein n=1 Tax=Phlebia brevispora TaxID=194682 RepID=A0ACC1TCU3_9APHY|nr:hypothetical protein NM688_g852 [Phlebia brevispora]
MRRQSSSPTLLGENGSSVPVQKRLGKGQSHRDIEESGYYRISTINGVPLGRGKLSEYDPSLVVALPRDSAAPKWFLHRRDSGRYVIIIDDLPVYFEQMALRINRENEEDRGIEWDIEPCEGQAGVYKFRNASIGPYRGFEDVWIAPNVSQEEDYANHPQVRTLMSDEETALNASIKVRVGDLEEVTETCALFKVVPA